MEKSTIIFSLIILILISSIIVLFVNISNIKKEYTNDINKIKLILVSNNNTLDKLSNTKDLLFDNLKVKSLEIINELKTPKILVDNLNSFNENSINVNNEVNIHKDINANPNAGLKIKLDIGDGIDKPYLGNKAKTFYIKNANTNYLIPFKNIIIKDITYDNHVSNNKLHNGNSSDYYIQYMTKEKEDEQKNQKENENQEEIENFTDLLNYY